MSDDERKKWLNHVLSWNLCKMKPGTDMNAEGTIGYGFNFLGVVDERSTGFKALGSDVRKTLTDRISVTLATAQGRSEVDYVFLVNPQTGDVFPDNANAQDFIRLMRGFCPTK